MARCATTRDAQKDTGIVQSDLADSAGGAVRTVCATVGETDSPPLTAVVDSADASCTQILTVTNVVRDSRSCRVWR